MPSSPRSPAESTDSVTAVCVVPSSRTSLAAPPCSSTNNSPMGEKSMAVGDDKLPPVLTRKSLKPSGNVVSARRSSRACMPSCRRRLDGVRRYELREILPRTRDRGRRIGCLLSCRRQSAPASRDGPEGVLAPERFSPMRPHSTQSGKKVGPTRKLIVGRPARSADDRLQFGCRIHRQRPRHYNTPATPGRLSTEEPHGKD